MPENIIASHSENVDEQLQNDVSNALSAFGLSDKQNEEPEQQTEETTEEEQNEEFQEDEGTPTDESEEVTANIEGVAVKYNGKETVLAGDELKEAAEKGLNYDKIKGRVETYEAALDRLAKQQGYKDHADLLANLDAVERATAQKQQDHFDQLKQHLRQEAEEAGIDPNVLDNYLDNHPLLQQAKEVVSRSQQEQELRKQQEEQNRLVSGWESLFKKYPHLTENVPQDGSKAEWLTPEMENRLARGYDPTDAYELVHRDSIIAEQKKKTEQAVLKNQRLNKRAQVESRSTAELEPEAPQELTAAFAAFGLNPKSANKYAKSFKK